jgi:predicted nucleotidyltransferase
MIIFLEPHKSFLKRLIGGNVDFLLVGGYAVNYYGYTRTTGDIDLWLRPDNDNRDRLVSVFLKEGFSEAGVQKIQSMDFRTMVAFHSGEMPFKIDFMTQISGITFPDAIAKKENLIVDDIIIPVINFEHLILSKMLTSRKRDQADVEELQKIRALTKQKKNAGI